MTLRSIITAIALAALLGAGWWLFRAGGDRERAKAAEAARVAAVAAQERERQLVKKVEEIARDEQEARAALAVAERDADTELGRLREALAGGGAADYPVAAPGADDAATLRELLGDCSGEYRRMAGEADRLRGQVVGLQAYVGAVRR